MCHNSFGIQDYKSFLLANYLEWLGNLLLYFPTYFNHDNHLNISPKKGENYN